MRTFPVSMLVAVGLAAANGCAAELGEPQTAATSGGEGLVMLAPSSMPVMLLNDAQLAELLTPVDSQEFESAKPDPTTGSKPVDGPKCQEL